MTLRWGFTVELFSFIAVVQVFGNNGSLYLHLNDPQSNGFFQYMEKISYTILLTEILSVHWNQDRWKSINPCLIGLSVLPRSLIIKPALT